MRSVTPEPVSASRVVRPLARGRRISALTALGVLGPRAIGQPALGGAGGL